MSENVEEIVKGLSTTEVAYCSVREGNFVEPCTALSANTDNAFSAFSKAKGVTRWAYSDMTTHEPSRTFFGVKTKAHPDGFLFSFCPFCGVDISAPFASKDDTK